MKIKKILKKVLTFMLILIILIVRKNTEGGCKMKKIVMIPKSLDDRHKCWRKVLTHVDKELSNGFAFIGDWLRAGERAEIEVGSLILAYDVVGSHKNWRPVVRVLKVGLETDLEEVYRWEGDFRERSWALAVRDDIAAILAEAQGQEPEEGSLLARFSDEELIAELERRGYAVFRCGIDSGTGAELIYRVSRKEGEK